METLELVPRGDVDITRDYGNRTVSFESGSEQLQRLWVAPRVTYSFSVEGDKAMRDYIDAFVDEVHGNLTPFNWEYDGKTVVVRFGESKVAWKDICGYGGAGVVGYRGTITLRALKGSES